MEFGTGAVKVTPAHDPNDYTCGKRNNLEFHIVLNENGTINNHGGNKYAGVKKNCNLWSVFVDWCCFCDG